MDDINEAILAKFPGAVEVIMSADTVELENETLNNYQPYPTEF